MAMTQEIATTPVAGQSIRIIPIAEAMPPRDKTEARSALSLGDLSRLQDLTHTKCPRPGAQNNQEQSDGCPRP